MIFRRNKTVTPTEGKAPVMRGRDTAAASDNPLARRFHPEDEPDTIDLQQPEGFNDEPGTADLTARPSAKELPSSHLGIVTMVAETGKFYVQPGSVGNDVFLGDEPVSAPTELRPGDRIKVGKLVLTLLRESEE